MSATSPFIEEVPWWRRLGVERKTFVSPLPRAECIRRIEAAIDPMFSPLGSRPAQGRVTGDGAVVRRRIWYRNSFQTVANLQFRDQSDHTRIEAEYGMRVALLLFAAVCALIVMAVAASVAIVQFSSKRNIDVSIVPFLLFPPVFLVGVSATALFVRSAARADKAFLDTFIKKALNASET